MVGDAAGAMRDAADGTDAAGGCETAGDAWKGVRPGRGRGLGASERDTGEERRGQITAAGRLWLAWGWPGLAGGPPTGGRRAGDWRLGRTQPCCEIGHGRGVRVSSANLCFVPARGGARRRTRCGIRTRAERAQRFSGVHNKAASSRSGGAFLQALERALQSRGLAEPRTHRILSLAARTRRLTGRLLHRARQLKPPSTGKLDNR